MNSPSLVDVLTALSAPGRRWSPRCCWRTRTTPASTSPRRSPVALPAARIDVRQAPVLGEDDRLVSVLRQRVTELGVSRLDDRLGVLVVAIGSSRPGGQRAHRPGRAEAVGGHPLGGRDHRVRDPTGTLAGRGRWTGCAARARAAWSSHRGSWRRVASPTGCRDSRRRRHRDGGTAGCPSSGGRDGAGPLRRGGRRADGGRSGLTPKRLRH